MRSVVRSRRSTATIGSWMGSTTRGAGRFDDDRSFQGIMQLHEDRGKSIYHGGINLYEDRKKFNYHGGVNMYEDRGKFNYHDVIKLYDHEGGQPNDSPTF